MTIGDYMDQHPIWTLIYISIIGGCYLWRGIFNAA